MNIPNILNTPMEYLINDLSYNIYRQLAIPDVFSLAEVSKLIYGRCTVWILTYSIYERCVFFRRSHLEYNIYTCPWEQYIVNGRSIPYAQLSIIDNLNAIYINYKDGKYNFVNRIYKFVHSTKAKVKLSSVNSWKRLQVYRIARAIGIMCTVVWQEHAHKKVIILTKV